MDLSKSFDTLNPNLLIAKLDAYSFNYNAFKQKWQRKINTSF